MDSCRRMTACWPSMGTTIATAAQRAQPSWYRFVIPTLITGFELCKNQAVFFHHPLESRGQTLSLCVWKREGVKAGWEFTPLNAPWFYHGDECEQHRLSQRCLLPSGLGTYRSVQTTTYSDHQQSDANCQKACQPVLWQHGFQQNLDSSGSEGVTVLSGSALERTRVA